MAETQLVKTEMNTELARPSILLPGYDELEVTRLTDVRLKANASINE